MRALFLVPLALVACKETNPDFCPAHPDDPRCGGTARDGGTDATDGKMVDALPDALGCFGVGAFEACPSSMATGTKTLSGAFDTGGSNAMCSSTQLWRTANTDTCFVVADTITVMDFTVTGTRPLALVAHTINVVGHLDAASRVVGGKIGPGAESPGACGTPGTPVMGSGAGGGAGASFATPGLKGGSGGSGAAGGGGSAYNPFLTTPTSALRGGCRGQTGATGNGPGGVGGYGGGAVFLLASQTLSLGGSSIIDACGAGGSAPGKSAGGGGGGTGGMIVLSGSSISVTNGAIVVANGGSGSTGADGVMGGNSTQGTDPDPTNPGTPAPGPTAPAGHGGDGFAQGATAVAAKVGGDTAVAGEGGGGGGGGGGYIQSNMALTNAKVSPAANVVP